MLNSVDLKFVFFWLKIAFICSRNWLFSTFFSHFLFSDLFLHVIMAKCVTLRYNLGMVLLSFSSNSGVILGPKVDQLGLELINCDQK